MYLSTKRPLSRVSAPMGMGCPDRLGLWEVRRIKGSNTVPQTGSRIACSSTMMIITFRYMISKIGHTIERGGPSS